MKSKTMCFSAALLLLVAVSAQGQDAAKPAFEWKLSGDTVETFKAEFVLNTPIDQSTAEGVVNGYALLTDNRSDNSKQSMEVYTKGAEIVQKATKPLFEKLLSEEMMKHRTDAEAAYNSAEASSYNAGATTITATTDGKDGAKLVETHQKTTYMAEGYDPETGEPTGKMEEQSWEVKYRYTCVKGEGDKWRIDRTEQMMTNWEKMDENGNAPEEWQETSNALSYYMNEVEQPKAEELKQDTPENTALSLFHCAFQSRDNWTADLSVRSRKGWMEAVKALFTEKGAKGPADSMEKYETAADKREVDKVSDGTDGVKKVKLKTRNEWAGAVEVHVKKVGDVWKIVNAGYYELEWTEMGEMKEGAFTETKDLDTLGWR